MTELASRDWRLIREEAHDGPTNMALDEVAAATAAAGGPRTVRVYRWDPGTVSLGYRQDGATIDRSAIEREGFDAVRRPTGGGAIFHDNWGDISYSIVAPAPELPGDLLEAYELLLTPLFDAFNRLGVPARSATESLPAIHEPACYLREVHPAHDVVVSTDGEPRKISGNAQYRRRDAVVQHGSITFASDPERHLSIFADPGVDPETFAGRVTSVREHADVGKEEVVRALETALEEWTGAEEGTWTEAERERARERVRNKFGTDAWTWHRERAREATEPAETDNDTEDVLAVGSGDALSEVDADLRDVTREGRR